jgi:hypothetical protein
VLVAEIHTAFGSGAGVFRDSSIPSSGIFLRRPVRGNYGSLLTVPAATDWAQLGAWDTVPRLRTSA